MKNNINEIMKPTAVAIVDTANALTGIINASGLPYFCTEAIVKNLYNQIKIMADAEYETAKQEYEQALTEQAKNEQETKNTEKKQP